MKQQLNQHNLTKLILFLVFTFSHVQYFFEINQKLLFIPVSLLILLGFLTLIFSPNYKLKYILFETFAPKSILFIFALPLVPTISSLFCETFDPALYGLTMIFTLIAIKIILCILSIKDILKAYFYASMIFILIFTLFSASNLTQSIFFGHRFTYFDMHPNLLGFILAGSVPAQFWILKETKKNKKFVMLSILISSLMIFYTSSRGSIISLVIGVIFISVLSCAKFFKTNFKKNKKKYFWKIIVLFYLMILVIGVSVFQREIILNYSSEILQLDNRYRGMGSGLSGRLDKWDFTLNALKNGSLLFGNGYRTGNINLRIDIDNGYLTIIYEVGLLITILILAKYFFVLFCFIREYMRFSVPQNNLILLMFIFTITVFFTNNLVARYLFGLGNPFSLLGLFIFVMSQKNVTFYQLKPNYEHPKLFNNTLSFNYNQN